MAQVVLCSLDELPQGGSLRADFGGDSHAQGIALIRKGNKVYAYINRCPHQDLPLDWQRGQFLDDRGQQIVCAMHGATFRLEDGRCVAGPCKGQRLHALNTCLQDSQVLVDGEELAAYCD